MAEEWRFVKGTRRFKVSDIGRVIDVESREICRCSKDGVTADLDGIDCDVRHLVYEAFVGPVPRGYRVMQRDPKQLFGRYNLYLEQPRPVPVARKRTGHPKAAGAGKAKKPIICVETGVKYDSVVEAAAILGLSRSNISHMLNDRMRTVGGFTFRYAEKEEQREQSHYRN